MMIIGVDYHPSFQAIAFFVEETGEYGEQELNHSDGQAERFYRDLKQRGISVRVGMEATGHSRWFERLLAELGFELWIGDPAEIKAKRVKKQKFDREDARLLLRLLRENNFPQIWVPDAENRDLRQLLWHRHRLVQMHADHESVACTGNERRLLLEEKAVQRKRASAVRKASVSSLGQSPPARVIGTPGSHGPHNRRVNRSCRAGSQEETRGHTADDASRCWCADGTGLRVDHRNSDAVSTGKQIGTYVGMIPCEESSARKQRLGHISKQGSSLLRFWLVQAAQAAVRIHPDWRRRYMHLAMRRHKNIAKVAMGRRLAVQLYWMWRNGCDYSASVGFGSYAGQLGTGNGVK